MAKAPVGYPKKREFETALHQWLLRCTCILYFGQPYLLCIILTYTEVNNGIWGSLHFLKTEDEGASSEQNIIEIDYSIFPMKHVFR